MYLTTELVAPFGAQRIAYFDRAAPGTAVLFVHGLGNAAANFEEMVAASMLGGHRLVRIRWQDDAARARRVLPNDCHR